SPHPAPTPIYTFPYTTLFRSRAAYAIAIPTWLRADRRLPHEVAASRSARSHLSQWRRRNPGDNFRRPAARRHLPDIDLERRNLRSEEHTSELQSLAYLVCRLL